MVTGYLLYGRSTVDDYKGCDSYAYAYCELFEMGLEDLSENLWGYGADVELWPFDIATEYCQLAKEEKIDYTLLFCEIKNKDEFVEDIPPGYIMLGYDVAWTAGDFYSAIYHEILKDSCNQYARKLNRYGLFDTWDQAKAFLESGLIIERGVFSVVKIYKGV